MSDGISEMFDRQAEELANDLPLPDGELMEPPASSYQVGGTHYQAAVQPWDIIDAWEMDFYEGNALKYLLRYRFKGKPLEDLEKLEHYVKRMKENYIGSL